MLKNTRQREEVHTFAHTHVNPKGKWRSGRCPFCISCAPAPPPLVPLSASLKTVRLLPHIESVAPYFLSEFTHNYLSLSLSLYPDTVIAIAELQLRVQQQEYELALRRANEVAQESALIVFTLPPLIGTYFTDVNCSSFRVGKSRARCAPEQNTVIVNIKKTDVEVYQPFTSFSPVLSLSLSISLSLPLSPVDSFSCWLYASYCQILSSFLRFSIVGSLFTSALFHILLFFGICRPLGTLENTGALIAEKEKRLSDLNQERMMAMKGKAEVHSDRIMCTFSVFSSTFHPPPFFFIFCFDHSKQMFNLSWHALLMQSRKAHAMFSCSTYEREEQDIELRKW